MNKIIFLLLIIVIFAAAIVVPEQFEFRRERQASIEKFTLSWQTDLDSRKKLELATELVKSYDNTQTWLSDFISPSSARASETICGNIEKEITLSSAFNNYQAVPTYSRVREIIKCN